MNYVILHYFFMVHLLCDIKMLPISKISHTNYDIDGFISQMLKSQKFDELSEKLAEKAAKKILSMQAASSSIIRLNSNGNGGNGNKVTQKKPIDVRLKKDNGKKIDPKVMLMNDATTPPENLKLKYKYLTNQAVMKASLDPEVDPSKNNRQAEIAGKKDHGNKTIPFTSNREVVAKSGDKKQFSGEDMHVLDKRAHVDVRMYANSDNEDTRENSKRQLTKHGGDSEQNSHDSKNSGPQFQDILKLGKSKSKKVRMNDKLRKFFQNSQDRSEEAQRRNTESEGDRGSGTSQFRNQNEGSDYNKVTSNSVFKPYRDADRSLSSEAGGRSRKEQSHEERARDQQDGDIKFRPVIKREGGKMYRYVEAPEYKDYHEDMLKWRKVHPENNADFMP